MPTLRERFRSKVDIRGPDECWPWMGAKDKGGYGRFDLQRSPRRIRRNAARISLELWIGPFQGFPLHSCDNPPCCNPRHLKAGSAFENMQQMVARGRYRGNFSATPLPVVLAIRSAFDQAPKDAVGRLMPGELAVLVDRFVLSGNTIRRIGMRKRFVLLG